MAQQTVPDNAYEIYKKKKARKRRGALELKQHQTVPDNLPLPALPHVRLFSLFDLPIIITTLHSLLSPPGTKQTWKSIMSSFYPQK